MGRTRLIVYGILDNRAYLTFRAAEPDWKHWTIGRKHIPRLLWWSARWRERHIVAPVLRERSRWTPEQLAVQGVLPI